MSSLLRSISLCLSLSTSRSTDFAVSVPVSKVTVVFQTTRGGPAYSMSYDVFHPTSSPRFFFQPFFFFPHFGSLAHTLIRKFGKTYIRLSRVPTYVGMQNVFGPIAIPIPTQYCNDFLLVFLSEPVETGDWIKNIHHISLEQTLVLSTYGCTSVVTST